LREVISFVRDKYDSVVGTHFVGGREEVYSMYAQGEEKVRNLPLFAYNPLRTIPCMLFVQSV